MPIPKTIQQLRDGRAAHKAWLVRAEALVNGLQVGDTQAPITASECEFGNWLQAESERLNGFSVFSQIEQKHKDFHQVYSKVYKLIFTKPKGMSKLFGQDKKTKSSNQLKASLLLPTLQGHYDLMMKLLETLEKDYLQLRPKYMPKLKATLPMKGVQTKSFRDVSKMMEDLEKDVDSWLK